MTPDPRTFELFRRLETDSGALASPSRQEEWPPSPPWRPTLEKDELNRVMPEESDRTLWEQLLRAPAPGGLEQSKGAVLSLPEDQVENGVSAGDRVRLAVNAAIHLRRPLLVSGDPGTGKTSLAYAIAWQLGLGPVLTWPITTRSRLREDGLYGYDAIGRLYATQIAAAQLETPADNAEAKRAAQEASSIGRFIKLGPVGTAFLPSRWPRVLLIDEIDKADLQLPNELLHLFEEGQFMIDELRREAGSNKESVQTCDERQVDIHGGKVQCHEFPIVVMTSNRERDFPPAFHRRCLRVDMPRPTQSSLEQLVKLHFRGRGASWNPAHDSLLDQSIKDFLVGGNNPDRAIDQLLNAIYLLTQTSAEQLAEAPIKELRQILQRRLSENG
ncbi:MAG: AAA family ATPase [Cyanobacteriota bacterium]